MRYLSSAGYVTLRTFRVMVGPVTIAVVVCALAGVRAQPVTQAGKIAELNAPIARAGLGALPAWTSPAGPACGKR